MTKKGKKLIILLVVLVVLAGVYLLVNHLVKKSEESDQEDTKTLISETAADITGIAFKSTEGDVKFTKTDDVWTLEGDTSFDADEDKVNAKVTALTGIGIQAELDDVSDLSEYGLSEPSNAITVTGKDGKETTIYLGSQNATTSDYYVYLSGDDTKVYSISTDLVTEFNISIEDLRYVETEDTESEDTASTDTTATDTTTDTTSTDTTADDTQTTQE